MVPYADLVTLLFALFTALYAVAAADAGRLPELAQGLRQAVGAPLPPPPSDGLLGQGPALVGPALPAQPDPDVRMAIEHALAADLTSGRLELIEDRRGLVLAIPEAFSFATGRADLAPDAETLLARVATVMAQLPSAIRIEGHTDNTPIRTERFTSNFELSTARATQVIAFFIGQGGIAPDRLSAAGYSEFHPRASNEAAEGRARNRRVDIVILNPATETSDEP
jgi:chemotaxis protein MotB